jgi:hypothetical protein
MQIERARSELSAALSARYAEIEQAALARVRAVSDPSEIANPEYVEGLHLAVTGALEYGIASLERSEERPLSIPTVLLSQARLAARNKISLDTVLRRYFAGYTLLGDFVIEEAERAGIRSTTALKRLLRVHASVFDRLLAAITDEYNREAERPITSEERRARLIERLLAGEPLDTSELGYDLEGCHLAVVGSGIEASLREIAAARGRNLLLIGSRDLGGRAAWGWLGGGRPFENEEIEGVLSWRWPASTAVAIGEPARGLAGWRFSHRQATAAFPVAQRRAKHAVRYTDVAMLACALQDEVLAASLRSLYLEPLAEERDGGVTHRKTLRAYFGADRNVSCAAAELEVSRQTIKNRLQAIQERLGPSNRSLGAEMELALAFDDISISQEKSCLPSQIDQASD